MTNEATPTKTKKAKYVLAGEHFATKKALIERVRSILHNVRGRLNEESQDFKLLATLVAYHPTPKEKRVFEMVGLRITPVRGAGRLDLIYEDGTTCDVSYRKCIDAFTGLDTRPHSVMKALRGAVAYQIEEYRLSQPVEIAYAADLVVDHAYPQTFKRLVKDFCAKEGITLKDIKLEGRYGWISDVAEPLGSRWCEYHRAHAILRMLPKKLNSKYGDRDPSSYDAA